MTTEPSIRTKPRRWPWIAGIVVALFVGVGVGASGDSEPEETEPETVEVEVPGEIPAEDIEAMDAREAAADERESELDELASRLDERESAITEIENAVAANSVSDGVWTVGLDIEPGTYRASDVSADCYWAVLVSGTNGEDIVNNGIPGGGNPSVTVAEGHDFETTGCGEWVKQ